MSLLLNLIWLVFGGLVMAFGYGVAALVFCILIVTIPFGIAAGRMALFCVWPFGRTLVRPCRASGGRVVAASMGAQRFPAPAQVTPADVHSGIRRRRGRRRRP